MVYIYFSFYSFVCVTNVAERLIGCQLKYSVFDVQQNMVEQSLFKEHFVVYCEIKTKEKGQFI